MKEGSGSGTIPRTNGSGSGRPKNMWIRWIRIRIRNTAYVQCSGSVTFWDGSKSRYGNFKLSRSPGIDSKESKPPAYLAWRAVLYGNPIPTRFLAPIDCSKIPALIRILIRALEYESGSGSCSFHQWLSRFQQKRFFLKVFCLLLTVGTFTSIFKDDKSLRSHKTVEIKVFLNFSFAGW